MTDTRFNEALVKLADQIATDDELDCLRFIATSVQNSKSNQFDKNAKEIFDILQNQQYLLPNKFTVVYDALTIMGRLDLRSTFLEEIGKSKYVHKGQSIDSFSKMLIDVRETFSVPSEEWEGLLFLYKKENGGAGVVRNKNSAYAAIQYLLDKGLLANDKQTLNKFARFLKDAQVVQGERRVKTYLNNHPEIPERISEQCTESNNRKYDETEQSDSLPSQKTTISGNENMILVGPHHVTINQVLAQPQSTNPSQGAIQQPIAKGPERFESLPANQQIGFHQQQPTSAMSQSVDQPTKIDQVGQGQRMTQGLEKSQGSKWPGGDPRTESDQQLLRATPTNRTESPEPEQAIQPLRVTMDSPDPENPSIDHQPSTMSDSGVISSGGSTGRSTPDGMAPLNPFSSVVNPFATGKWCTDKKCRRFTKDEIEKMKKEKIGQGGFGIVYHGIWLRKDGEEHLDVAIKVFDESIAVGSGQGKEQFENELKTVELSKHCFSSTVLGYCQDQNYKALVYPYMKNKDLKTMLDANSPHLTWKIRLRILYQICAVMCHFHNQHNGRDGGRCVHGDVKADNIFLDDNFNAFLGDFGILTFLRETGTSITKVHKISTLGYIDPDAGTRLSQSSDIYQFGVLSFRCLTSKPAYDNGVAWCSNLAARKEKFIQESKDDLLEIVDRTIWKSEPIIETLTDMVIRCTVRKSNDLKRNFLNKKIFHHMMEVKTSYAFVAK